VNVVFWVKPCRPPVKKQKEAIKFIACNDTDDSLRIEKSRYKATRLANMKHKKKENKQFFHKRP
jgi:hypothetical protein